jgi:hypothetical protein
MANCYLCGKNIKTPKHTLYKKYICKKCYFKQKLKNKLKFWK